MLLTLVLYVPYWLLVGVRCACDVGSGCWMLLAMMLYLYGTAGSGTLVCLRRRRRCLLLGRLDVARMDGLTIIQPHHAKNELTSKIDEHYFDG